jgi:ornithine--oxo-acid transaminase
VVRAIKAELDRNGPAMLQGHVPELAGELAQRLCTQAGGRLSKVFFCSSGSEGVEAAIKFSRAHTRRAGILYAGGGFHGLTCGALSLMDNPFWTAEFGPLLPQTQAVPFGDLVQLEKHLSSKKFAAYVVEPIQAEAGVLLPPSGYLEEAQSLCRRYGTLFVLDEVQTGMYRIGSFLAAHHFKVEPDMVILAKAISGGLVPSGAVLMSDAVYDSVYSSFKRSIIHTSTYSENSLSMRAGLATLDVLADGNLGERSERLGQYLRDQLKSRLLRYDMIKQIRGLGMMSGIEFRPPKKIRLRILFEAFENSSGDVRPGSGDASVPRPSDLQSNLRQQLHGAQSRSRAGDKRSAAGSVRRCDGIRRRFDACLDRLLDRGSGHGASRHKCHLDRARSQYF